MKLESTAHRAAEIVALHGPEDGAEDAASRLELSFSSEDPYRRYSWKREGYFHEVLGHREGEVDLSRMTSGVAPLLTDHRNSVSHQIGVVEKAWLEGGKGRAVVRFATTPDAQAVRQKISDGILSTVSVGYRIKGGTETGETRDGEPVVRITDWLPYEVSLVAIPADPTVGVGRAEANGADIVDIHSIEKGADMPKDELTADQSRSGAPAQDVDLDAIRREAAAEGARKAKADAQEMDALVRHLALPEDFVREARDNDWTLGEFKHKAFDLVEARGGPPTDSGANRIGMAAEDVQQWSLEKALRYLTAPSRSTEKEAGFEIECSRAYEDKTGKTSRGLFIPDDVILADGWSRNAHNTTTSADGGALVPETYMAGSFIDLLRKRSALVPLGARFMSGLRGDVDIPKRLSGAVLGFYTEGEDTQEGTNTFGRVPMGPHTASMALSLSRKLRDHGSPDTEALLRDDLLQGAATGTDAAALVGGFGANAPTSLRDKLLPDKENFAAAGEPTFREMVRLWRRVAEESADMGNMGYVFGAAVAEVLMTTPKLPGGDTPIMGETRTVNGYRTVISEQIPAGEVIFGNWSDLMVGYFSGFDLKRDDAALAASDGTVIRLFVDMDTSERHLESFSMGS